MPAFIHPDFILDNAAARTLYHEFAKAMPILDYHCHLSPEDVATNRTFANLYDIWLAGDHYKWRAMRAAGVAETYCTGEAEPYEKFLAWARTVPQTLRNPLYHWTHLELKRYFDIDTLLNAESAREIWEEANRQLARAEMSAHGILKRFRVELVGTTDDPADPLDHHAAIARSDLATRVIPTFRPDKAFAMKDVQAWNAWIDRLSSAANMEISGVSSLLQALRKQHDLFGEHGCCLSDHGLETPPFISCTDVEAARIFDQARSGNLPNPTQQEAFATCVLQHVARWNCEKGWGMQLHIGALRNNRSWVHRHLGSDAGADSIGDHTHAEKLAALLDSLDREQALPKTILYNLNPADNYVMASMIGNFQDGSIPGKLQFGSGWWFLDQEEGMRWQINALSSQGLLARFIGMLTDSRSFLSYPRHEYFRRILCNLLGGDIETGRLPDDMALIGAMVQDICYHNAHRYLQSDASRG